MMNISTRLILLFSIFFLPIYQLIAQEEPATRPYTLTHHMSPEEKARFHLVGKGYKATDPPPS